MMNQVAQAVPADLRSRDAHWQILFGTAPRTLVVPAHHRRAQHRSVEFFIANPLRRAWAHVLLEANRLWPGASLLPGLPAPARQSANTAAVAHTAFQIGTPGPYQKASMLIMNDDGEPVALSKVALKPSADPMIDNEMRWLEEFDLHPTLAGRVPRLLGHGRTYGGRRYLLVSIALGRRGAGAFTAAHSAFLRELAKLRSCELAFVDSPAHRYLAESLAQIGPPSRLGALLAQSLDECRERLRGWKGPFVFAHGDFVPWNIRRRGRGIVAFDWEYAEEGAIALRDVCYFLLIPRALARGGIDPERMRAVVEEVGSIAHAIHPEVSWERSTVAALVLACLMHTVLFHAVSRGYVPQDDAIVNVYRWLIEERARWIG